MIFLMSEDYKCEDGPCGNGVEPCRNCFYGAGIWVEMSGYKDPKAVRGFKIEYEDQPFMGIKTRYRYVPEEDIFNE